MSGPGDRHQGDSAAPHAATRRSYDRLSRWYDLLSARTERPARDAGLALLAPRPGETVLELGPGTGHGLVALGKAVGPAGRVCAIDLSAGMLGMARRRLARAAGGGRVALAQGDALRLPLRDACCDAAQAAFVLELFPDAELQPVVAELQRVLRPGGRLGVVTLAERGPRHAVRRLYEWAHRRFPAVVDCRPIRARELLEAAGFRGVERAELSMWGLAVDALVARRP